MEENIIERLKLTEQEVLTVVSEWYQNGMYKDILRMRMAMRFAK